MNTESLSPFRIKSSDGYLRTVKSYLDLISRSETLVYGTGLKRLYALTSGVPTFNQNEIEAIVAKSERDGLIPQNLHGFMMTSILTNLELYGRGLQKLIHDRIMDISGGYVQNPETTIRRNQVAARRLYYVPPANFIMRLQKALNEDGGPIGYSFSVPPVNSLQDVANDADLLLARMQMDEGHITPNSSSWGALSSCVDQLIDRLAAEARFAVPDRDYRTRSRGALKILWFISKLLLGDLTTSPLHKDINLTDLDQRLNMSDGTLACIPFPIPGVLTLFADEDRCGITLKGRFYLSAVSSTAFERITSDSE